MRLIFLFFVLLGIISCKNTSDAPDSETSELPTDSVVVETPNEIDKQYAPTQDKVDGSVLIIEGTKMLEGELDPGNKILSYRIKGSTSKEMVIQLIAKSQDIYFNIRVEEGETIAEKQRKFMFTVASNEVLVLDITSDKPLVEKAVINTIISHL